MKRVYLDYSATTPLSPEVLEAMRPHFLENYGNASSVHHFGRKAREVLDLSRDSIAMFLGARFDELFFTSGGTESDNHAVRGVALAGKQSGRNHLVVSAVEHQAVLQPALSLRKEGFEVDLLSVDREGIVNLTELQRLVSSRTSLVSVMQANNEVGTIQPLREISDIAHRAGAAVHTDSVQALGKTRVNVGELGVDILTVSAHKIYGPKGIGALYIKKGTNIRSLIEGGGQEQNRRAGTENVPLAAGFAKAITLTRESMERGDPERCRQLREQLRERLKMEFQGLMINGHPTLTLPTILSISFDSSAAMVDGEALIMGMDLERVAVTSGSACASGTLEPSHVLLAMGRDLDTARATIRFSLGRETTEEEVDFAVDALHNVVKKRSR